MSKRTQRQQAIRRLAAGDVGGAQALFREILDESPADARAWDDVGWALKETAPAVAVPYFDRALELAPGLVNAWIGRGMAVADPTESLRCFERALAIEADNANAWFLKSCALRDLDRTDDAEAALRRAGELDPATYGRPS